MLTIKSNRTTYHIDGLTIRTAATNDNEDKIAARGYVADCSQNACGALTRSYRFQIGKEFESAAEALKYAETCARAYGRKMCKHCRTAAMAMILDEAYAENEARYAEAQAQADAEQVIDFVLEVVEPEESLEVRTEDGRRFPTELRLDLTGPLLEVFVPRDEDDETFALDAEPDSFGVYDAEDCGRLYWTIPLLELDEAKRFLADVTREAERVVAGSEWRSGYFELSQAAQDATDRIGLRCAQLAS